MKHMKRDNPAFRLLSCSLRTTNMMYVVEQSGPNSHCSSSKSPFASQSSLCFLATTFLENLTRVRHERDAVVVSALSLVALLVEYVNDRVLALLRNFSLAPDESGKSVELQQDGPILPKFTFQQFHGKAVQPHFFRLYH